MLCRVQSFVCRPYTRPLRTPLDEVVINASHEPSFTTFLFSNCLLDLCALSSAYNLRPSLGQAANSPHVRFGRHVQITISLSFYLLTIDHLDPNLPSLCAVQDLYGTDPTQKTCPRSCRFYDSRPATWTRSYRSYTPRIYLSMYPERSRS